MLIFRIFFNVKHVVLRQTEVISVEAAWQRVGASARVHLGWRVESVVVDAALVAATELVEFFEVI